MTEPTEQETYRKGIDERFDRQDDMLQSIVSQGEETLTQVKYTNGRVTKLEIERAVFLAQLKIVRGMLYVIGAALTFVVGQIAVPLISSLIQTGRI